METKNQSWSCPVITPGLLRGAAEARSNPFLTEISGSGLLLTETDFSVCLRKQGAQPARDSESLSPEGPHCLGVARADGECPLFTTPVLLEVCAILLALGSKQSSAKPNT